MTIPAANPPCTGRFVSASASNRHRRGTTALEKILNHNASECSLLQINERRQEEQGKHPPPCHRRSQCLRD
ncbi:hypothetical protein OAE79_02180 [Rhodopirellula sp.]|nr:hypothetical protein [Rhodopirellula sp.]